MTPVKAPNRRIGNDLEGGGLLAAIVQSSDDAIISSDLDGRILSWNPGAERMFGFTHDEIAGKSIAVLISPDLRDEQRHIFDRVKAGEHVEHYETVRVTKTGERIDVSLTLSPLRNAMGAIVGISGIVRDITSQRRSRHALLHRLKFEEFLFELSKTFLGMTEQEIDANMASGLEHVGKFLGMDRVTLLELSPDRTGMSVAYTWSGPRAPKIPPAIRTRNQPWWVGRVLRGETSLLSHPDDLPEEAAAEKEYLRQRGVQSAASIPLKVGGEIAGAIAFATVHRRVSWTDDLVGELRAIADILWNALKRRQTMQALQAAREAAERAVREREALRASEERYRGLAEQVIDGIFITDRTARIVDANRAACDLLGYTLQELRTLRPEEVISAEELPKLREMVSVVSEQIVRTEFRLRRKDGSMFIGEVAGRQLPDGRLQAVVRDVSERREAEEIERRLHEITRRSLGTATLQDVLEAILEAVVATAHADFGNIQLLDADASHLRIVAHRGFPQRWIDYWKATPRKHGACGTALSVGERVVIEDVEQSPIFSAADLEMHRRAGVRALQSTPLVSRSGKPIGMLSTHYKRPWRPDARILQRLDLLAHEAADLIGHAQAETELKRQAALLDLAQNSILVRDFDGRISYWNEGATQCYGWTRKEAIGKELQMLLHTQFPEPLERILDTVKSVGYWHGELGHTCRDGRRIIVDSRWTIQRASDGEGVHILQINNDITERKRAEAALRESEQQLQSYIDQAGDAIYVLDGESGRILNANMRATQMLGYSRDELLRLSAWEIESAHTPAAIADIHRNMTGGIVEAEGEHRRKDGSKFPIELRMTTLMPTRPHRILAIVRDVSERKRLEQERAEAVRRKDEFLASIGHELRNPLAAIHTAGQALSRNPSPPQRAMMEEIICTQTMLMRRLVDDLLDLERISHGHIELKLGPVDLADSLRRVVAPVQSTIAGRNQQLVLQLPPESVRFIADGTRLDQIVMNLLTNASKYSARGCRIELSGVKEDSHVVIRCKDNGQGIALEHQQTIFEPFSRGSKTDLGYGEASVGLGLALVKQLTKLHGGTISVESGGAGRGSEFTVRLPFVSPPSFQRTPDEEPKSARMLRRPLSLVLVEDNPNVAKSLQAALEQAGHSVRSFADAPSVLAGVSTLTPDAILIDIGLPGMDGYELAAKLRQQANTKSAVLVAVTGFRRRDRVAGDVFDHYFNKPLDVDALLAVLEER